MQPHDLPDWPRPHLMPGGFPPLLLYQVFGNADTSQPLNARRYRSAQTPPDMTLLRLDRQHNPSSFVDLLRKPSAESFRRSLPDLDKLVEASATIHDLRGSPRDYNTLNYFRDAIGLITYLLDNGALFVVDWLQLRCWSAEGWRREVFSPAEPCPWLHCVIRWCEDEACFGRLWYYTRGLRKFGRPDISIHRVPVKHARLVEDLCARLIVFQALGAVLTTDYEIRIKQLPLGHVSPVLGDFDDLDFNNVHHEISFPEWQ